MRRRYSTVAAQRVWSRLSIPEMATLCGSHGPDYKARGWQVLFCLSLLYLYTVIFKLQNHSLIFISLVLAGPCAMLRVRFLVFDMTLTLCSSDYLFFLYVSSHAWPWDLRIMCTCHNRVQPV